MKKTIAIILLFTVMFCTFYNLTFEDFNNSLSGIVSSVENIASFVSTKSAFLFLSNPSVSSGELDHYPCYLNCFGLPYDYEFYSNEEISTYLYSWDILVDGVYYGCFCVYHYVSYSNSFDFYIVSSDNPSLIGKTFTLTWLPFVWYVGSFHDGPYRNVSNKLLTTKTLSDFDHICVAASTN